MSDEDSGSSTLAPYELIGQARRTLEGVIGIPATEGNRVTVLHNGREIFPAMLDAIRGAEHPIDFLTFVYWKGEIGSEVAESIRVAGSGAPYSNVSMNISSLPCAMSLRK